MLCPAGTQCQYEVLGLLSAARQQHYQHGGGNDPAGCRSVFCIACWIDYRLHRNATYMHGCTIGKLRAAMCPAGLLMAGTVYQALRKLLFQMSGPGLHGQVRPIQSYDARIAPNSARPPTLCRPRRHCRFPLQTHSLTPCLI